jgi:hypothetical protein
MNGKRILFLGLICLAVTATAQASLVWEKTELALTPAVGDATAVGVFKYTNKGDAPIHFKSVKPSCGCTTAAMQKNDVGPGEKGEITATFTIGDRSGPQVKTITVETDDPQHPQTVLTLKADVTQYLELQPSTLYWQGGEEATAKTIVAKAGKGVNIKNVEVTSSSADFTTKVEPGAGAGEFKISVQPSKTTKPVNATLSIKPDVTPAKVYYAAVRVMSPTVPKPGS